MFVQGAGYRIAGAVSWVEERDMSDRHGLAGTVSVASDPNLLVLEKVDERSRSILEMIEAVLRFDFNEGMVLLAARVVLEVGRVNFDVVGTRHIASVR